LTEKELRTKSNEYNAATALTMGYQEVRNSAANWQTIMRLFAEGRAKDLNQESKKLLQPVILTGSGPSFDNTIGKLKDWTGGIICHYSQAVTLMRYGIEPDYIMALDSICNWEKLSVVDWSKTKTKLVLHPGMWPSLVENWPNEMLFYRQNMGRPDGFGVTQQKLMYSEQVGTLEDALESKMAFRPLIQTELTMFACTPPGQLFVAHVLQYGNVFLTGNDFCYHGEQERFTDWDKVDGEWVERKHILDPAKDNYIITNTGHRTDPIHLYYKKNFISACRLSMQQVYTTDKGAITEIPYIDFDKVISGKGKKVPAIDPEVRKKNYERYLAGINCFVINLDSGSAFVEVQNPIQDLTGFMVQKNRSYKCQACGADAIAKDDNDHNGDKCSNCGRNGLKQSAKVDIQENLKRFNALVEYVKEVG
jgi:hypothetical protein